MCRFPPRCETLNNTGARSRRPSYTLCGPTSFCIARLVRASGVESETGRRKGAHILTPQDRSPSYALMALPELRELLPARLGLQTLWRCRGVAEKHSSWVSNVLQLLPNPGSTSGPPSSYGRTSAGETAASHCSIPGREHGTNRLRVALAKQRHT